MRHWNFALLFETPYWKREKSAMYVHESNSHNDISPDSRKDRLPLPSINSGAQDMEQEVSKNSLEVAEEPKLGATAPIFMNRSPTQVTLNYEKNQFLLCTAITVKGSTKCCSIVLSRVNVLHIALCMHQKTPVKDICTRVWEGNTSEKPKLAAGILISSAALQWSWTLLDTVFCMYIVKEHLESSISNCNIIRSDIS